jgi:GAF domain-containing protein
LETDRCASVILAALAGVTDLEQDGQWPLFSEAAVNREVRAVLASPLPYDQDAVGVVAVLSERSRPWSPANELALLTFTDLAALLIASIIQGEQQPELAGQLQGALNSRQVIEQAKGVLMGAQGISARAAYEQLRSRARAERRKLPVVCAEMVQGFVANNRRPLDDRHHRARYRPHPRPPRGGGPRRRRPPAPLVAVRR